MPLNNPPNPHDLRILRELFQRKKELALHPVIAERRQLWTQHASLHPQRPMILAETCGVLDELVPLSTLQCQAEWARGLERGLRELIFRCEQVDDDWVVEPCIPWQWAVTIGDYGVQTEMVYGHNEGRLASYHWDPPIQDLERDFDKLHFRILSVDREGSFAWRDFLQEHFGDILPVEFRANYWWTTGLTWEAIKLIGLQPLMMMMYDNPAGLHRLMAFLRDEFLHLMDWFEREELLSPNNQDDYIGSGSIGYTNDLPYPSPLPLSLQGEGQEPLSPERSYAEPPFPFSSPAPFSPSSPIPFSLQGEGERPVRICDLWGLSESQETVGVSPRLFEEFILPYQQPVISRFGLSYYGCCEPVHTRIHLIKHIPNLRRVSVSPWCDQAVLARECAGKYIFCRKPNPTLISTEVFDEDAIRQDLRTTLQAARGCALELVMKDVHTLNNQPHRLGRWVQIARQEIAHA